MKCFHLILLLLCINLSFAEKTHRVVSGDTLNKIALKYGTTTKALQKHNAIRNANLLRVGQLIKIPCNLPNTPQNLNRAARNKSHKPTRYYSNSRTNKLHTVRRGETFFRIAKKYGTDTYTLSSINPNVEPDKIFVGQRLTIPTASTKVDEVKRQKFYEESEKSDLQRLAEQTPAALTSPYTKVIVTKQISLANFAKKYKMSVTQVNNVNGWNYPAQTIFDIGSEAYVVHR